MAYAALEEYAAAERCLREALTAHREIGLRWREAVTLSHIGRVQRDTGRLPEALATWQQALGILDKVGDMDQTDLSRADLVELIEGVNV
jgi:tetratricopeptide (TPR) repeat protein